MSLLLTKPRRFVTIDPGLGASGYAYWIDGALHRCGLLRSRPKTKSINERLTEQRQAWSDVCRELATLGGFECVVAERMIHRHIPRKRGVKGIYIDPQDLINVSLVSGTFGTLFVAPHVWKAAPRDVEQDHSRHALSEGELSLVEAVLPASLRKEAWSAVGIGLSINERAHLKCGWGLE